MRRTLVLVSCLCLAGVQAIGAAADGPGTAAPPAFTSKPVVTRDGDRTTIAFAVNRATDVAVSIEDAGGAVVRHLAAGVLGTNAPAPLKSNSLAQSLVWDGRDDDGQLVSGVGVQAGPTMTNDAAKPPVTKPFVYQPPFHFRVGLGLQASYAGQAFAETNQLGPNRIESVMGMAAGADGRLRLLTVCNGWVWGGSKVQLFRRDGAYEKTIKPFPADLPIERARAAGVFRNSFGGFNPLKYQLMTLSFYPAEDLSHQPAVTSDGRLVLAVQPCNLAIIDRDGGLPEESYAGPALGANLGFSGFPFLAAASDDKSVFLTGLAAKGRNLPAVYRVKLPERGPAEACFGDAALAGSDNTHLNDPRGVAVDGKGHLLVADFGNNRVLVLNEKDASFAGKLDVASPNWIAVHPKNGALYVQSADAVIKFSGWENAREVCRFPLPKPEDKRQFWRLALDSSAEPAVLWSATGTRLLRAADQGEKFADAAPADCFPAQQFWRPAVDPYRREVLCKTFTAQYSSAIKILDEKSGSVRVVPGPQGKYGLGGIEGRQHRLAPNGDILAQDHALPVIRYDRNGKLKPFEATATNAYLRGRLPVGCTGTTNWERDFSVDRRGNIYVKASGPEYHGLMSVHVYDAQGNFKWIILQVVSDAAYGPRIDPQGNLYVMDSVGPRECMYPEEFKAAITGRGIGGIYNWIYGSIVKFSSAGGSIWFNGGQALPLTYEGWGQANRNVLNLRTTDGALTGTLIGKSAAVSFPDVKLDAATCTKITFRLKNESDGTQAVLGYQNSFDYGASSFSKAIAIQPNSDFTEYTFDLSGEKEWKKTIKSLTLAPSTAAKGAFRIDWVRVGEGGASQTWNFNAEESAETKLPSILPKETIGAYDRANGATLQGALWWKPGFSPVGDLGPHTDRWHCHCTGSDFDVDDFGRVFAPDTGRFRVVVLDTNGNEIMAFGAYGNQDNLGPESYVIDPATQLLRPRKSDDPKEILSPAAKPEIAFAWIVGLAVTDRHAYVDDTVNKRMLRIKLGYSAEEVCDVK
jgi:hypothetical protein